MFRKLLSKTDEVTESASTCHELNSKGLAKQGIYSDGFLQIPFVKWDGADTATVALFVKNSRIDVDPCGKIRIAYEFKKSSSLIEKCLVAFPGNYIVWLPNGFYFVLPTLSVLRNYDLEDNNHE